MNRFEWAQFDLSAASSDPAVGHDHAAARLKCFEFARDC